MTGGDGVGALDAALAPLRVVDRLARLRAGIEAAGVDALLVTALNVGIGLRRRRT